MALDGQMGLGKDLQASFSIAASWKCFCFCSCLSVLGIEAGVPAILGVSNGFLRDDGLGVCPTEASTLVKVEFDDARYVERSDSSISSQLDHKR